MLTTYEMPNIFGIYNERKDHPKFVAYQKKMPKRKLSMSDPAVWIVVIVIIATIAIVG